MFAIKHRPRTFSEVFGQEVAKKILISILKKPHQSPRSLIFYGHSGTGKTTLARIFARNLNCEAKVNGLGCNVCSVCTSSLEDALYYKEYDSAILNTKVVNSIRDYICFYMSETNYRVIVLDECHLLPRDLQSSFLKPLEEASPRVFFVWCTTNVERLLDTIRSRSLEIPFEPLDDLSMTSCINSIAAKENLTLPDDVLKIILRKSKGHPRLAMQLLNLYAVNPEDFLSSVFDLTHTIESFFKKALKKEDCKELISYLSSHPLPVLEEDFSQLILSYADDVYISLSKEEWKKSIVQSYLKFRPYLVSNVSWHIYLNMIYKSLSSGV